MNLNFSMSELIKSEKAKQNNINNMPNTEQLDNILNLIVYCLQPIRELLNRPVIITSGFRCKQLNKLINGKTNSQHLKGEAADFCVFGITVQKTIDSISKSNIEYDQLINEYDKWVHISYSKGKNRRQKPFCIK